MAEHLEEVVPRTPHAEAPVAAGSMPDAAGRGLAAAALGAAGSLGGVDPQIARGMMHRLGPHVGNAAIARAVTTPEPSREVRSRVEAVTGYDLSAATIHPGSSHAAAAGIDGVTVGRDVHLAPGITPGTGHGDHVLAHELAHVVQQGTDMLGTPGGRTALEADAESVAMRTRSASAPTATLAPLPPPRVMAAQFFDPRYHRTSVVEGLDGSGFTPDEVGAIYAANWERDLSQAHPSLGNVILAWKTMKVAAYEKRLTEADMAAFQGSCQTVLETVVAEIAMTGSAKGFADARAYGGYQFYEHMDNPAGGAPGSAQADQAAKMTVALKGKATGGLPPHIYISREYIKETLFEAAKLSQPGLAGTPTAAIAAGSADTRANLLAGPGTPTAGGIPAAAVAAETSHEVQARTPGATGGGATRDPRAYAMIGRASHALEDFWSHSNFVERAIGDPDFQLGGLTTATFGDDDTTHALAHKIRGAADEIEAEMPLLDRLAGRRTTDPSPGEVHVGDEDPVKHEDDAQDLMGAIGQIGSVVGSLGDATVKGFQRGYDRGTAMKGGKYGVPDVALGLLSGVEGAVVGAVTDIVGSKAGVLALRAVAEHLDESTEKKQLATGDFQAHGLLAKDQPGHEDDAFGRLKTIKFELAHALSVEADKRITAKMHAVLEATDAGDADARLQAIFTELDSLIADALPGHPLWGIVESHRKEAEDALAAHAASKPGAGDLAPTGPVDTARA